MAKIGNFRFLMQSIKLSKEIFFKVLNNIKTLDAIYTSDVFSKDNRNVSLKTNKLIIQKPLNSWR